MSAFTGTGIRLGGDDRTLQDVRRVQQANYTAHRDYQATRAKHLLEENNRLAQENEVIKKVEANPTNKGKQEVALIHKKRAAAQNLDAAFAKLDEAGGGLLDGFRVFAGACNDALGEADLDDQVAARDNLAATFAALKLALQLDEFKVVQANVKSPSAVEFNVSTDYKKLVLFQQKAVAAWDNLKRLIDKKTLEEVEAAKKARQEARDQELEAQLAEAIKQEKAAQGKKSTAYKPKPPAVLKTPGNLPATASATALAVYTWAYNHATDVNQANWRVAYQDPSNRPLGPSYPATETLTFPGGVRQIAASSAPVRVSQAVIDEVRALWDRQTLVVGENKVGNQLLSGSTNPHVSGSSGNHINLVLERANVVTNASVLNLHVRIS